MDTKSKKFRYSTGMKMLAAFLIWASLAGIFSVLVFVGFHSDDFYYKNYYETSEFGLKFRDYVRHAAEAAGMAENTAAAAADTARAKVYPVDMTDTKAKLAEAAGMTGNTAAAAVDTAGEKVNPVDVADTKVNAVDMAEGKINEVDMTETEENTAALAAEDDIRRMEAGDKLKSSRNFLYAITGANGEIVASNIDRQMIPELKSAKLYFIMKGRDSYVSVGRFSAWYPDFVLKDTSHTLYAAVADNLSEGDVFYDLKTEHDAKQALIPYFFAISAFSLLLGFSCLIYLIIVAGHNGYGTEIRPAFIDRLYNDVHTVAVCFAAVLSISLATHLTNGTVFYLGDRLYEEIISIAAVVVLLTADLFIGLSYILSMARHIKRKTLFRHTLLYKVCQGLASMLRQCFSAKAFKPSIVLLLLAYGGLNAFLFALATHSDFRAFWFFLLILTVLNLAVVYFLVKALASLSEIMIWVGEMVKGNLDKNPDELKLSPAFALFAKDIGNLQSGIRKAVFEAVKGERLKTELISNVSHDLKTPLTSIINYVDLLQKENPESESIREYIGILEEKSGRLKQLIDDLIEASKAASGDMSVNLNDIDLCSLVSQAIGEYNEKIQSKDLDFRIKACDRPVVVRGDGTLVWRIMDNLLSNVVKYAQRSSRVYIGMDQTETAGTITIRNISDAPLGIPVEQLLERFVRGDGSRSTEGSGLGLSIAKSLAEIQGGNLELVIDGDLFKVIVSLPASVSGAAEVPEQNG